MYAGLLKPHPFLTFNSKPAFKSPSTNQQEDPGQETNVEMFLLDHVTVRNYLTEVKETRCTS